MGRVRTKTVKKSARLVVERFYQKLSQNDFDTNKRICDEVCVVPSKRMRNKIAGFVTHLMRRIESGGNVRGISLKLQEEERERRLDFVPEESALRTNPGEIKVDKDTQAMLKKLGCALEVGLADERKRFRGNFKGKRGDGPRRPRGPVGSAPAAGK